MCDETVELLTLARSCFTEFVGDTIFVFIGSLSGGSASAHGLTIAVLIIAMGHISGGHFNPAVTLGVLVSQNIRPIAAVCYMVAQLLGGVCGAILVRVAPPSRLPRVQIVLCNLQAVTSTAAYNAIVGGATITGPFSGGWASALLCEVVLTYLLVLTVLCAAVDSEGGNVLAGLAIGLSITADIYAGGHISGASMNPARSFGPAVVYEVFGSEIMNHWHHHYIYYIGPALGAVMAAASYRLVFAKTEKRLKLAGTFGST